MSLGIHRIWKNKLCQQIPNLNAKILDVAGGTGDITLKLIEKAKRQHKNPCITLCDLNEQMLKIALNRAIDNNILHNIEYVCADAEDLPFKDNSFDYYIIAFGIRNITKIEVALQEAYRVLKPREKFLCLEFSKVENDLIKQFYSFYSFNIIPKIGQLVTQNKEAYKYLVETIELFPDQQTFNHMILEAGFKNCHYQNLTYGIAAIHSAYKI